MTILSDDFNRADGTGIGSMWEEVGGEWTILGNRLASPRTAPAVATNRFVRSVDSLATADQYVESRTRVTTNSTPLGGPMLRMTDGTVNGYGLVMVPAATAGQSVLRTVRVTNGSILNIQSVTGLTFAANTDYTLGLEAQGTELRAYLNEVMVSVVNDATHSTGRKVGYVALEAVNAARYHLVDWITGGDIAPLGATVGMKIGGILTEKPIMMMKDGVLMPVPPW